METFETADLLPFKAGIEAGAPFVLVSHNIVNCMDPELPASLSPAGHIRFCGKTCGFEGIAITDDLAMDAVKAYAKDGAVAVMALAGGERYGRYHGLPDPDPRRHCGGAGGHIG